MVSAEQLSWETLHDAYDRRVLMLCKKLGITWFVDEREQLLDRLMHIAGDPVTGPDLLVVVALYNRELIGRRRLPVKENEE